jgi:2-(1,2-epoxy-1,2-dihydrophenyl)acetyl-CoA isomerase
MPEPAVLFERKGAVAIVTLNRPETLNALASVMVDGFIAAVREIERDTSVKAMVLTGAGKGFCSGMDIGDMGNSDRPKSHLVWPRPRYDLQPATLLRGLNVPVIGAINGVAAGAGMSIALSTDIRIMSDRSRMVPLFIKRGLMPDMGGNYLLQKLVGSQKALELLWAGESLPPDECLRLGLVSRVVPHEELMAAAVALGEQFASKPSVAVALIKRHIYRAESVSLETDLEFGSFSQERLMTTKDFKEGYRAYVEKRDPKFKGE